MTFPSKRYTAYQVGDEIKWIGNRYGPFYGVIKSVKVRWFRSPKYLIEWYGENGSTTTNRHEDVIRTYK